MPHHSKKQKSPKLLPAPEEFALRHGISVDTARAILQQACGSSGSSKGSR